MYARGVPPFDEPPRTDPVLVRRPFRFEKVLDDEEQLDEVGDNSMTTIGRFARKLLLEQEYHDTMLPRLPVPVQREIQKKLEERPPVIQPTKPTQTAPLRRFRSTNAVAQVGGEAAENPSRSWEKQREDRHDWRDERARDDERPPRDFRDESGGGAASRGRDEAGGYANYERR